MTMCSSFALREGKTEKEAFVKEKINQFVINDIAYIARLTDETFKPSEDTFVVNLDTLSNSQSYLTFNLGLFSSKTSPASDGSIASLLGPYSD